MAQVVLTLIELLENEQAALVKLSELERRDPRQQAAVIIRRELERCGLLKSADHGQEAAQCPAQ